MVAETFNCPIGLTVGCWAGTAGVADSAGTGGATGLVAQKALPMANALLQRKAFRHVECNGLGTSHLFFCEITRPASG
jgi:hypothetical protein